MERFRIKQMHALLRKAAQAERQKPSLGSPKEGKINPELIMGIIEDILEAEQFVYSSKPSHILFKEDSEILCAKLLSARSKLDQILIDFGVLEEINREEQVKKITQKMLIITPKSNYKKHAIKLGVDPQRIVVTGVPLIAEDMQKINPKIHENALEGIKKKIEHTKRDIERKLELFKPELVLVLADNDQTGKLLASRADELYDSQKILTDNFKDMGVQEFLNALSNI